jgi:hypothetical protein
MHETPNEAAFNVRPEFTAPKCTFFPSLVPAYSRGLAQPKGYASFSNQSKEFDRTQETKEREQKI